MRPRSFRIQIWGPKRWPAPIKSGVPCNFCLIKFLPKCMLSLLRHPRPLLYTLYPGGGGPGSNPPKNIPALQDHLCDKFHCNPSSGSDFYSEHTYRHSDIALAWVTWHCPGWFKWGFKNSIEIIRFSLMTQACWDSQIALQTNALSLWSSTIGRIPIYNINYNF